MPDDGELLVHIDFDPDARVWYIAKSDVPGLRLEAENPFRLIERIAGAAAELLELNPRSHPRSATSAVRWRPVFDSALELQTA